MFQIQNILGVEKSLDSRDTLNNVNDNVVKYNLTNNDNEKIQQNSTQSSTKFEKAKMVELTAARLVEALNAPGSKSFFCKVAYRLNESQIAMNLEVALRSGRTPARLFVWLCSRDMAV